MAHFAQINENNIVLKVIVINNSDTLDAAGNESESVGIAFCKSLFGGDWVQTSYNANFRKHYAGIGYVFNKQLNVFIPIKPYESWVLNTDSYIWEAPTSKPDDGKSYKWDEPSLSWIERI